jgi:hypothetical protein
MNMIFALTNHLPDADFHDPNIFSEVTDRVLFLWSKDKSQCISFRIVYAFRAAMVVMIGVDPDYELKANGVHVKQGYQISVDMTQSIEFIGEGIHSNLLVTDLEVMNTTRVQVFVESGRRYIFDHSTITVGNENYQIAVTDEEDEDDLMTVTWNPRRNKFAFDAVQSSVSIYNVGGDDICVPFGEFKSEQLISYKEVYLRFCKFEMANLKIEKVQD